MLFLAALVAADAPDPITALANHDYAAVGGWGIAVMLGLYMVFGLSREWIVPGRRYRRMEEALTKAMEANDKLATQNGQLITANEITKHFFEETAPKRGAS